MHCTKVDERSWNILPRRKIRNAIQSIKGTARFATVVSFQNVTEVAKKMKSFGMQVKWMRKFIVFIFII